MRRPFLILLLGVVRALFEDQVDKIDWFTQHIGKVTNSIFHSTGPHRLALVATELGVVAGVDLRQGTISWRQVLQQDEAIIDLQLYGKALISVGKIPSGFFVRSWTTQGSLMWDAFIDSDGESSVAAPVVVATGSAVVVAWRTTVTAFQASSGAQLWRVELSEESSMGPILAMFAYTTTEVYIYATSTTTRGGSAFVAAKLDIDKGERTELHSFGDVTGQLTSPLVVTLDKKYVAGVSPNGAKLIVHPIGTKSLHSIDLLTYNLGVSGVITSLTLPSAVAVQTQDGGSAVIKFVAGKSAPVVELLKQLGSTAQLAYATNKEGSVLLAAVTTEAEHLSVNSLQIQSDGTTGSWITEDSLPWSVAQHGLVERAWLNAYSRKDGSMGHRLLVSGQDHSLRLLQAAKDGSRSTWVREESLATVQQAELMPMPSMSVDGEKLERPSFAFAFPAFVAGIQERLSVTSSSTTSAPPVLHADTYGTRQVVLAQTSGSKAFGLHSTDGSIIWSHFVSPLDPGDTPPTLHSLHLSGHGTSPQAIILAQGSMSWGVVALHPFSGKLLAESKHKGKVLHATRLPYHLPSGLAPLLIVDTDLVVHLYPSTSEAIALLTEHCANIFFHILNPAVPTLLGYSIESTSSGFIATQRWNLVFPGDGAKVSLAHFPLDAAVHSPVRVLGDRSVLYKYVNRNAIALGISLPEAKTEEASIQVMLVDGVSGRVLFSAKHSNCEGPMNMLLGENWILYEYWSKALMQHQISISEFYTNSTVSDDLLSLVLSGPIDYSQRANMFDSFAPSSSDLYQLSQSYAFGTSVAAMGLSQTAMGATPKNVLIATSAGQLVIFDKRLLDPRRPQLANPQKMTQEDREEGLIPYAPSLGGINPLTVLSHRHVIKRPRNIVCAPTTLESTTLVLVVGLDLFLSRVAPAKEFDRLNEDFNFVALVGATVFLVVATIGSGWFASRKDLARQWR